ncbi:MAG: thiamine phosphate synthase [Muribaculaceae bacterium]|nr:thiamine phosphate synthase [Muribaculaceae bacterium]
MNKLIVAVTPEREVEGESGIIAEMLRAGADFVHIRHPEASTAEVKRIIENVPHPMRRKLRLHGHFDLVWEFNLGGLHLNGRCPRPPAGYSGSLSLTCHSLPEVADAAADGRYDYVTLSPICASVSKPGYGGNAFTSADLDSIEPRHRVVALGGITPDLIPGLERYNFVGYALLGTLWNSRHPADIIRKIRKL